MIGDDHETPSRPTNLICDQNRASLLYHASWQQHGTFWQQAMLRRGYFMQPDKQLKHFIKAQDVLADRVRLAIVLYLSVRGNARFKEVSEGLELSSGNLAHHLGKLQEAGYINIKKSFDDLRIRVLSLTPLGRCALTDFLASLHVAPESQPEARLNQHAEYRD